MKKRILFLIALLFSSLHAQNDPINNNVEQILAKSNIVSKDISTAFLKNDVSHLWTKTPSNMIFGFFGSDNFQRLQIKILTVKRDKRNKALYHVTGKNKRLGKVFDFKGTFEISRVYKTHDPEKENSNTGLIKGLYELFENKIIANAGEFTGLFITYWYKDPKGSVCYDDLLGVTDDFNNNQFVGLWNSYKARIACSCNWGDHRIPASGKLDVGAGEFCPDEKYEKYGWKNYSDAYLRQNENSQKAKQIELEEWWK